MTFTPIPPHRTARCGRRRWCGWRARRGCLGGGGAAYVENNPLASHQVIPLVRAAGGIVSLAHPYQLRRQSFAQLEAIIRELAEQGMQGLETLHGSHTTDQVHALTRLADRLELIPTGGSDYHGTNKPWIRPGEAGTRRAVPRRYYEELVATLAQAGERGRISADKVDSRC